MNLPKTRSNTLHIHDLSEMEQKSASEAGLLYLGMGEMFSLLTRWYKTLLKALVKEIHHCVRKFKISGKS